MLQRVGATNLRFKLDLNRAVSAWLKVRDGKTSLINLPSWPLQHSLSVKMPCRNPVYSVALFCFTVRPSVRLPDHVSKTTASCCLFKNTFTFNPDNQESDLWLASWGSFLRTLANLRGVFQTRLLHATAGVSCHDHFSFNLSATKSCCERR